MKHNENINILIHYWFDKAKRSMATAENELKAGNKDFCANRIYYAAFYAVSAALLSKGLRFKKHSAVRAEFHKEFIKTKVIPQEYGILYDTILRDREDADYVAFTLLEEDVLKQEIKEVKKFITLMEEITKKN
jgi:uncharacterized protein (UPF0332 family)